jgi:(1->4)-alpha-D-glucan 1-alpha-D-glucosylmutase
VSDGALQRLAVACGIALEYHDVEGRLHRADDDTLRALLRAMGIDAEGDDGVAEAAADLVRGHCRECVPPRTVRRSSVRPWRVRVRLKAAHAGRPLAWRVASEAGDRCERAVSSSRTTTGAPFMLDGTHYVDVDLDVDVDLPEGYHAIELSSASDVLGRGMLAIAPPACYRPPALRGGRRFGVSVQLYGVRSRRNWGIGDFSDLGALAQTSHRLGADVVAINPLHALFPDRPAQASPYSPSSRIFLNVLYLDVEAIPEFGHCEGARARFSAGEFQRALAALRAAPLVDYEGVARAKLPMLELLYRQARHDAESGATSRWIAFDAFKTKGGDALRHHALFEALQAHFAAGDSSVSGWPAWPPPYRDPDASAVRAFADAHAGRVDFHAWLQWQAALQRADAAALARTCGAAIGLCADLAISVDRGGADAWAQQTLYGGGVSVGAPPDAFNAGGQDWGLPPWIPRRLREAAYAPFIATLRANMRDAGALRIDHVMGLRRLYWVPAGAMPAHGAYVRYPFEDLLGLVALESRRQRCLVIGEDLGTVPDQVREALAANDILSYRVLLFEREAHGAFKPPSAYPEPALATASTHDLPTLTGWWEGTDIALRAAHGQLRTDTGVDDAMAERIRDRGRMLEALAAAALLPEDTPVDPLATPRLTPALALVLQRYLARTPSALLIVQAEDALGVAEQANLPGTTVEHPNWRRRLPVDLDDLESDVRVRALMARIAAERLIAR